MRRGNNIYVADVWLSFGAEADLGFVAPCTTRVKRVFVPERAPLRFLSWAIDAQPLAPPLPDPGSDDLAIVLRPGQALNVRVKCLVHGARHWRWSWRRPFKSPERETLCAVAFFVEEALGAT